MEARGEDGLYYPEILSGEIRFPDPADTDIIFKDSFENPSLRSGYSIIIVVIVETIDQAR